MEGESQGAEALHSHVGPRARNPGIFTVAVSQGHILHISCKPM